MRLSAPQRVTWWVAVIVGVIGLLMGLGALSVAGISAFWVMVIAWLILVFATLLKGL